MIALISNQISSQFQNATGIKTFPLMPYNKLDLPVSSHADMLICVIDKNVFCYSDYYNESKSIFDEIEKLGYKIIKVNHQCDIKYPHDIGLNALVIGKKIFCKRNYIAKEIIEYGEANGYKIINVNQGYSACSTFIIDENSVITSDLGMQKAFQNEGINTIIVPNNNIILDGYNCGFVGGCGCILDNNAYFFGSIKDTFIENCADIEAFFEIKNIKFHKVIDGRLRDFGGVKTFY
ncbi:MAG: hypothetical protein II984_03980 [Clostridia bacterium]|nr:hypothetical protein [Clostridia bacterium]